MTDDTNVAEERQFGWISPAIALVTILALVGLGVGWRGLSDAQGNRQALNADIEKVNEGSARYATDMQLFQARVAQDERTNADL
jgi:hypothetical protein